MKILFIITRNDDIGGAQIYTSNLAHAFHKEGHEVAIAAGGCSNSLMETALIKGAFSFFNLKHLKHQIHPLYDVLAILELIKLIKQFKPNIVSINSSKVGIIGRLACFLTKTPNVFTVHGWSCTNGIAMPKKQLFRIVETFMGFFSDKVIVISKFDYNFALRKKIIDKRKLVFLYNGINPLMFNKKIALPGDDTKTKILMLARHDHQKDHLTLFNAIKEIDNVQVILLGGGPFLEKNKQIAQDLGIAHKVSFEGYKTNVSDYLFSADIFALISHYEGFPLSTLEAMSASLPLLVSNVCGAGECIEDGYNGYKIPPGNAEYLKNRLIELIANPALRRQMGKNSYELYKNKFHFNIMFEQTKQLFLSVSQKKALK